jgi:hypothetical protein
MRQENTLITSEIENVKKAGIRENTKIRIGNLFLNVYEWFSDLIYNLQQNLNSKVDKVNGKQLSDENFTLTEKNKLSALQNYIKPEKEPISYIENLQTVLDSKENLSNKVDLIPSDEQEFSAKYPSIKLLLDELSKIKESTFSSQEYVLNRQQVEFKNGKNQVISTLSLAFLSNIGSFLDYNKVRKEFELKNQKGEVLNSIPVSDFLSSVPKEIKFDDVNNYQVNLVDVNNQTVSSVDLKPLFKLIEWNQAYNHSNITSGNPHNTKFSDLKEIPTTLSGFGILDGVQKDGNKQLSDENFTLSFKQKLESLENYVKPQNEPVTYITGLDGRLKVIEQSIVGINQNLTNNQIILSTGVFTH